MLKTRLIPLLAVFAWCAAVAAAHAQQEGVLQSGLITPGHPPIWVTSGVIGDAGSALSGNLTELGITNTGTPFCINDAPITGQYHQVCLGANALGGGLLSYNAYGGAPKLPLLCNINGVQSLCLANVAGLPSVASNAALQATSTATAPIVYRAGFYTQGDGGAAYYTASPSPCTLNSGNGDNGLQVKSADGKCWKLVSQAFYDPRIWGADATGATDSAPALRAMFAAFASDFHFVFADGTYNLCSTAPAPFPAFGPNGVLVQGKNNFVIDFGSAKITVCNGISGTAAGLAYFHFDGNSNYQVYGGTFVGNMTGKPSSGGLTAALVMTNDVNFMYANQTCNGDFQSTGAGGECFGGDFDVNGMLLNSNMQNVANCFDFAFLQNVRFLGFNATGMYHSGPGSTCYNTFYDSANLGNNTTGYPIADTSNVVVDGNATNFATGWHLASGSGYTIDGFYTVNPGAGAAAGYGGIVDYGGTGHPVSNVVVRGHYDSNGSSGNPGGGIFIQNAAGTDFTSGISINAECSNNIASCLQSNTSVSNISNVRAKVTCSGASQTNCIGPLIFALLYPQAVASGIVANNGVPFNVTQLTLPPGQWELSGGVGFAPGGTGPSITYQAAALSQTSGTLPSGAGVVGYSAVQSVANNDVILQTGTAMVNPGAPTIYYLVAQCNFSAGNTCTVGGTLTAARQ